ncbi:B12-binding domain-containing radical SAM protein, partial [Deinococcus planocerae]|uniref:B12-binding domain-containing radical SAM protein n=1 Tax=Deinococcus planocerae TaxID=1737569 RepID=UPI0015E10141
MALFQLYGELQFSNWEPIACEALAAHLEQFIPGVHADIIPINPELDPKALQSIVGAYEAGTYAVMGISAPQGTYALVEELALALQHARRPQRPPLLVFGGSMPTNDPETHLKLFPEAVMVRGWGEAPLARIVEGVLDGSLHLAGIPGISFMQGDVPSNNPVVTHALWNHQAVKPKRINVDSYFSCVETSRGCHYGHCTFCVRPPGKKSDWTRVPLDVITASLEEIRSSGQKFFTFVDEDFVGHDLSGAIAIADVLRGMPELQFTFSIRADNIRNPRGTQEENDQRIEMLRRLKDAGLVRVYVGVEALCDAQLKRYGKGISQELHLHNDGEALPAEKIWECLRHRFWGSASAFWQMSSWPFQP